MISRKSIPDRELLVQLLSYNPETGLLTWKTRSEELGASYGFTVQSVRMWNARYSGKLAASRLRHGYVGVKIFGQTYFAHRVIWKMAHGVDPDHVDHVNGRKGDNRLANLRDVTAAENQKNRKLTEASRSGVIGVRWCKSTNAWVARIGVHGKTITLGRHSDFSSAVEERRGAEREYGFHENHGRT
jgi:hypothetical protein